MASHITRSHTKLNWGLFKPKSGKLFDPKDGSEVDALTGFNYQYQTHVPHKVVKGKYQAHLPASWVISIALEAEITTSANRTPQILIA